MALNVPLSAVPSQSFAITLDGQPCNITVEQKSTGLYFSLLFQGQPITVNARCLNLALLLQDRRYLGFVGDFAFADLAAAQDPLTGADPDYTGLGSRFFLSYLQAADIA